METCSTGFSSSLAAPAKAPVDADVQHTADRNQSFADDAKLNPPKFILPPHEKSPSNSGAFCLICTLIYIFLTFAASNPFCPLTTSNSTESPSRRDLNPSPAISGKPQKTKSPFSCSRKPNPFESLNHVTFPIAIFLLTPLRFFITRYQFRAEINFDDVTFSSELLVVYLLSTVCNPPFLRFFRFAHRRTRKKMPAGVPVSCRPDARNQK